MIKYLEKTDNFKEEIKEGIVLVDFFATWCGPCQMLSPVLEDFSSDADNVKVIKVDIDEYEDLARENGIMSVPTLIVYKDGSEVTKHMGYAPKEKIEALIEN